jgi:septum formation protein
MILQHLEGRRLILASKSPRRLELVRGLGLNPEVAVREIDESWPAALAGPDVAAHVTRKKAEAFLPELRPEDVVITGDTVVLLPTPEGYRVLEKPADRGDAIAMLLELQGRSHLVASGVAVTTRDRGISLEVDTCEVTFSAFDEATAAHYVDTCTPFDKAGAYGVQDFMGLAHAVKLNGSFYTVMGLPTHVLYRLLTEL